MEVDSVVDDNKRTEIEERRKRFIAYQDAVQYRRRLEALVHPELQLHQWPRGRNARSNNLVRIHYITVAIRKDEEQFYEDSYSGVLTCLIQYDDKTSAVPSFPFRAPPVLFAQLQAYPWQKNIMGSEDWFVDMANLARVKSTLLQSHSPGTPPRVAFLQRVIFTLKSIESVPLFEITFECRDGSRFVSKAPTGPSPSYPLVECLPPVKKNKKKSSPYFVHTRQYSAWTRRDAVVEQAYSQIKYVDTPFATANNPQNRRLHVSLGNRGGIDPPVRVYLDYTDARAEERDWQGQVWPKTAAKSWFDDVQKLRALVGKCIKETEEVLYFGLVLVPTYPWQLKDGSRAANLSDLLEPVVWTKDQSSGVVRMYTGTCPNNHTSDAYRVFQPVFRMKLQAQSMDDRWEIAQELREWTSACP